MGRQACHPLSLQLCVQFNCSSMFRPLLASTHLGSGAVSAAGSIRIARINPQLHSSGCSPPQPIAHFELHFTPTHKQIAEQSVLTFSLNQRARSSFPAFLAHCSVISVRRLHARASPVRLADEPDGASSGRGVHLTSASRAPHPARIDRRFYRIGLPISFER